MPKPVDSSRPVYFVDGLRTPFLKARGKPGPFNAADLGVMCAKPLLLRQSFNPEDLDQVIAGCVNSGVDEANIARIIALRLGCGDKVTAWTVQRNCASGLQSIDSAMQAIASGQSDLVLAGGVEAMSKAPLVWQDSMVTWLAGFNRAKTIPAKLQSIFSLKLKNMAPIISLLRGLQDPVVGMSMGQTAEKIAHRFNITRADMDAYAVESHKRLHAAQEENRLSEVHALFDSRGNHYTCDDGVRPDSSVEKLAKLRPVFDKKYGNVTAGNSAQITDGASWLILASERAVKEHNLPVIGRAVDLTWAGLDPTEMGLGPAHAIPPLLINNNLSMSDIDLWEINEAFAAQVLACVSALNSEEYCKEHLGLNEAAGLIPQERMNIDGGGVSLGHPVGVSGTRITLHLLDVLRRNKKKRGIASLCIGGGQGGAILVENMEVTS